MFGFPKSEYKRFKSNFLKTVIFQIKFEKCLNIENNSDNIKKIFEEDFPRVTQGEGNGFEIILGNEAPNIQKTSKSYRLNLKSKDGQKVIDINEDSLNYTITGASYISFRHIVTDIKNIVSFLKVCDVTTVNRIALRKVNIVEFKNNDNPSDILNYLLNHALVSNLLEFPNREKINHNIQTVTYKDENRQLNLRYGFNLPPQLESEIGQLIIDIDIFNIENTEISRILSEAELINSEIFNIFNWVINENAKNILNDEN